MVKPRKEARVRRRVLSVSLYLGTWLLLTGFAPAWLLGAALVGIFRRRSFIILRLLMFAWVFFGVELLALVWVGGVFVRSPDDASLQARLFELQMWWSHTLLRTAVALLGLRVEIEHGDVVPPGPAIVLMRHESILDTLLPSVYLQRPSAWRVRYVLKQELLFDPCIDIVGNAMHDYFVDRTGDHEAELLGIAKLAENIGTDGVLIYPEGTRFSPEKRERALARIARSAPALLADAQALTRVLPPRPGGVLALLEALPGVDCVFFAHSGLEALEKVKDVFSGEIVGSNVVGTVWRVPRSQIPTSEVERVRWLYDQWARVNRFVIEAQTRATTAPVDPPTPQQDNPLRS